MIPKIIHYCWFGNNAIGEKENKCIETWKKVLPQYQIVEWSEKNFNISESCEYVRQAFEEKKWAFVSDYVRLDALKNYGGIYLDTDVEVLKSFDPFLNCNVFFGMESKYSICTATIGSEKNAELICELLELYRDKIFVENGKIDNTPNSKMIFKFLENKYNYVYQEDSIGRYDNFVVYPEDFFSPINCYTMKKNITENTISIHHYASSWKRPKDRFKDVVLVGLARVIGEEGREKVKRMIKGDKGEN